MITPGRLWWLFSRDCKRGLSASWHARYTAEEILRRKKPATGSVVEGVPVHVLTGSETWLLSVWMLASWEHYSARRWQIVLHDDGTLTDEACSVLVELFPGAVVIRRREADREVGRALKDMRLCQEYRRRHPLALKIFDVPLLCREGRFILLDSDVLFFKRPEGILKWVDDGGIDCFFNEDVEESALVSAAGALEIFKIRLWRRVNSGLCLVYREAIKPEFCEEYLARTEMLQGPLWRVEQTLFALCAARHGHGGLLSPCYEVSLGWNARPDVVARHYVGAVRDRFYGEGMARLKKVLFATE